MAYYIVGLYISRVIPSNQLGYTIGESTSSLAFAVSRYPREPFSLEQKAIEVAKNLIIPYKLWQKTL
jgi:hypothetical protein